MFVFLGFPLLPKVGPDTPILVPFRVPNGQKKQDHFSGWFFTLICICDRNSGVRFRRSFFFLWRTKGKIKVIFFFFSKFDCLILIALKNPPEKWSCFSFYLLGTQKGAIVGFIWPHYYQALCWCKTPKAVKCKKRIIQKSSFSIKFISNLK